MKRAAGALALLVATTQPVLAQTAKPGQPVPQRPAGTAEMLACDAPAGRFSQYRRVVGPAPLRFGATIRFNELRQHEKAAPTVVVQFSGGKTDLRAGFRIVADPRTGLAEVVAVVPGMKVNEGFSFGAVNFRAPLRIEFAGTPEGSQLALNGIVRTGPGLVKGDWLFEMSCSTVDATIADITVGR